jgi:hypothetical protein
MNLGQRARGRLKSRAVRRKMLSGKRKGAARHRIRLSSRAVMYVVGAVGCKLQV